MKGINLFTACQLKHWESDVCINGEWTPARPTGIGNLVWRLKLAWMVFSGKADVVKWNDQ